MTTRAMVQNSRPIWVFIFYKSQQNGGYSYFRIAQYYSYCTNQQLHHVLSNNTPMFAFSPVLRKTPDRKRGDIACNLHLDVIFNRCLPFRSQKCILYCNISRRILSNTCCSNTLKFIIHTLSLTPHDKTSFHPMPIGLFHLSSTIAKVQQMWRHSPSAFVKITLVILQGKCFHVWDGI